MSNEFIGPFEDTRDNPYGADTLNPEIYDSVNQVVTELNGIQKDFNSTLAKQLNSLEKKTSDLPTATSGELWSNLVNTMSSGTLLPGIAPPTLPVIPGTPGLSVGPPPIFDGKVCSFSDWATPIPEECKKWCYNINFLLFKKPISFSHPKLLFIGPQVSPGNPPVMASFGKFTFDELKGEWEKLKNVLEAYGVHHWNIGSLPEVCLPNVGPGNNVGVGTPNIPPIVPPIGSGPTTPTSPGSCPPPVINVTCPPPVIENHVHVDCPTPPPLPPTCEEKCEAIEDEEEKKLCLEKCPTKQEYQNHLQWMTTFKGMKQLHDYVEVFGFPTDKLQGENPMQTMQFAAQALKELGKSKATLTLGSIING